MKLTTLMLSVVVLFVLAVAPSYAFQGTLAWMDGPSSQITAYGDWAAPTTSITWDVTNYGSHWLYTYSLNVTRKDISHFIIETSGSEEKPIVIEGPGVVNPDIWDIAGSGGAGGASSDSPRHWSTAQGASNIFMPDGGMYGIKFEAVSDSRSWTVSFKSNRPPVWGDFYAKDGMGVAAYNAGFTGGYFDGSAANLVTRDGTYLDTQLAVPDTRSGSTVPEPSSIAALVLGLPALALAARRRR